MSRDSKKYPRKGDTFEANLASSRFRMVIMDADELTVDTLVIIVGAHDEERRTYDIGLFRILVGPWEPTYVAPDAKRDPKTEPKERDVWRKNGTDKQFTVTSVRADGDVFGRLKIGTWERSICVAAKHWPGFIKNATFQHGPGIPVVAKERDPLKTPVVGDVWKSRYGDRRVRVAEFDGARVKLQKGEHQPFTVRVHSLPAVLCRYDLEIDALKATAKPFTDPPKTTASPDRNMATHPVPGDKWIGKHGNNEDLEREVTGVDALGDVAYKTYQKDGSIREYRMPLRLFTAYCKNWKPLHRGDMTEWKPAGRDARETPVVRDLWTTRLSRREITAVDDKHVEYTLNDRGQFTIARDQFFERSQEWGEVTVAERREAEAPKRARSIEEEAIIDPRVGDAWGYIFESGSKGRREITEVKDGMISWKNPEFGLMIFTRPIKEMRPAFNGWTLNYRARAASEKPQPKPPEQQKPTAAPVMPETTTFVLPVNVVPILFVMQPGADGKIVAMGEGSNPDIKTFEPSELPAGLRKMLMNSLERRLAQKLAENDGKAAGEIALATHGLQMVK